MKKTLIAIPAVLAALVIILLIAPSFMDWSAYKTQAQEQVKVMTGHDLQIDGDLSLALLPAPHVYIESAKVNAPEGSTDQYLITLDRLDLNLALAPLFKGEVVFGSIDLVKPVISLEVFEDGRQNWMTAELDKLSEDKEGAEPAPAGGPAVSVEDISIKDGQFKYFDRKTGKPVLLENVNVDVAADTMAGPFAIEGTATALGQDVAFDAKTGALPSNETAALPVNLEAELEQSGARLIFAGVINTREPFGAQGETTLTVPSVKDFATGEAAASLSDLGRIEIKGLLTADEKSFDYKNATLMLGGNVFNGDLNAGLEPLTVKAALASSKPVDLDQLIKLPEGGSGDASNPVALLPQTLNVPDGFAADIKLTAPSLVFNGRTYQNATLAFLAKDKSFTGGFAAASLPGGGHIDAQAGLAYAEKTADAKTGQATLSGPYMMLKVKGQADNLPEALKGVPGAQNFAVPAFVKSAAFDAAMEVTAQAFNLKDSTVQINDTAMQVSGSYEPVVKGGRPKLVLDIAADKFDADAFMQQSGDDAQQGGDLTETLQGLSLPMDLDFDIGVQDAKIQGHQVKGLLAQGAIRENSISLENLSAQQFAGSSFKIEGGVSDLKALSGITLKVAGESKDIRGLAEALKIDAASLPQNVNAASLNAAASGSINALDVNANVSALGGDFIAKGNVSNPLGTLKIGNLALQVKHRSMAQALKMFAPSAPYYSSWEKPLDFYAEVERQDNGYVLRNMKGDLAGATVAGNISYTEGSRPVIKGNLDIGNLVMVSGRGPVTASGAAASTPRTATGERWSKAPIDTAWMKAFDAVLSVKAQSIVYETWNLQNPSLAFSLNNGTMSISELNSDLFGGKMALSGKVVSPAEAGKGPVALDGNAKFENVSVEKLVQAFVGVPIIKGQGLITSMDATVKGSGNSMYALVSSLNGGGAMDGKNIILEGFDLTRFARAMSEETKPGDTALGLWKTSIKGGSTAFDTLIGSYTINQGIVNINKLELNGAQAFLETKGNISLPAWTIQTAHTITLKDNTEIPPFTINISGPLDNPGDTFGQGLINDYLKRKINRKIENFISEKIGEKLGFPAPAAGDEAVPPAAPDAAPGTQPAQPVQQQPPQPPGEITPEDAVKGLLNEFLKR